MPVADQIKSLTHDIEVSHEARVAEVSDIVKETHQALSNFHQERAEMSRDLRRSLAENRRERIEMVRNLSSSRLANREELTNRVQKIKVENNKSFKENSEGMANFLADAKKERKEEFSALIGEIKSVVAAIEQDTDESLANFNHDHQEMANNLRKNLRKTVDTMITDFSGERQQSRNHWQNLSRNIETTRIKVTR